MPIYEYRCENGHLFEVMQKITDDPVTHCTTCEAAVQRVFHPVAVHFKGSGFYNTDYGTAKRKREQDARSKKDSGSSSSSNSGSSDSGSGASPDGAAKADSKSSSTAASGS